MQELESTPDPLKHSTHLLCVLLLAAAVGILAFSHGHPLLRASIRPMPVYDPVNVNQADAASLSLLPGIGPSLAARIIKHRRDAGPYASLADLDQVKMIGPKTLARLKPWITFGNPQSPPNPNPQSSHGTLRVTR